MSDARFSSIPTAETTYAPKTAARLSLHPPSSALAVSRPCDRRQYTWPIGHKRKGLEQRYNFDEAWKLGDEAFAKVSDHVAQLLGRAAEEGKGRRHPGTPLARQPPLPALGARPERRGFVLDAIILR
jgi:hypothetical protein